MRPTANAGRDGGVLVANPGGISWMIQSAAMLAEHGELAAYCSPATYSERELERLEERLPARIAPPVLAQLRLRSTPTTVPDELISRAATGAEVAYVFANRLGLPKGPVSLLHHGRAIAFDSAVSRAVKPGMDAVIGYHSTAAKTFRVARSRGVATVLDYPIAHYHEVERELGDEVKRVPAYAHTMQGPHYEPWRKRRFQQEIDIADRIIMVSSYHWRTFVEAGVDESRLFMAHFGVDLDWFSPGEPREDNTFRVLFCGAISQRKGISYLVDAFKRAELADAELVFIGRPVGNTHPWIDEPRVRHVGALPRPKLADVYRSGDVIVLPSLIEGFPATPLEGMACGLPAIVSTNTFGHDVIEDGVDGWVTPIRDADAIAEKLRVLYEDRDLARRMGAAARTKALRFNWQQYGDALRAGIAAIPPSR